MLFKLTATNEKLPDWVEASVVKPRSDWFDTAFALIEIPTLEGLREVCEKSSAPLIVTFGTESYDDGRTSVGEIEIYNAYRE